jgi:hypothetical protein
MGYVVVREGKRIDRQLGGRRTLAEILTEGEYRRVEEGSLVALTDGGGLMSPSSPLHEGQVVHLRPPSPARDLAAFGFRINRAGDLVGIEEMLAVRAYEERHGADLYELPLAEIQGRVRDEQAERAAEARAVAAEIARERPLPRQVAKPSAALNARDRVRASAYARAA